MLDIDIRLDYDNFNLDVSFCTDSTVTGIFGPSGAGKSTLLSCIAGLAKPDHGHIIVGGGTLFDDKNRIDVSIHKRKIGMVFQDCRLFPNYSVEGNLKYGMTARQKKDRSRLLRIADVLEITHLLKQGIHDLSGGEKQRTAIGRAILSGPDILLLDEPFCALDKALTQKIIDYIDTISIPVIIVSHEITTMLAMTDHIVFLENGSPIFNVYLPA